MIKDQALEDRRRIWVTLAFLMAGTLVAGFLQVGLLMSFGYSLEDVRGGMPDLGPNELLLLLGLTQLVSYLVPGIIAARTLSGSVWTHDVGLHPLPPFGKLLLGLLIFIFTLILTGYLAQLNASLDLSDWQADIEGDIAGILSGIILETSTPVFLGVLLIVGVVPALGEELVFRGLLQPAMIRLTGSSHFGIWLTAAMFGLVHLQFAGILPRIFLGAVLGFLAYRSQRLWIPIAAHFLFNASQAVAARLGYLDIEQLEGTATSTPSPWLLLVGAALAGAALHFGLPYLEPKTVLVAASIDEEE